MKNVRGRERRREESGMEKQGAKLANPEHVEILKQGVEVWNDRIIY